jgi:CTP:molybdopterin cytidylyltransferase MocA
LDHRLLRTLVYEGSAGKPVVVEDDVFKADHQLSPDAEPILDMNR